MRTYLLSLFIICSIQSINSQEIQWMSWSEAVEKASSEKNPKKIFVDVYTNWCGWCKKMDKNTFNNPKVLDYMKDKYYMVKLDAEQKEDIQYKGKTFKFIEQGRNGYHELAAALLQGKLSFPTTIFLNANQEILSPVPGYQGPEDFLKIAKYFGDDIYKDKSWQEYDTPKS
ncbi:hypothetical protein I215_02243 [Galbibacter marinus]|uniref:Spermatogenesis-associated protein 20-like TRX domain-containing protein n=1 Tax=Galbibacter marinus TaxID=555500 RepID=K2PUJ5_9FLAO|nr:DUF255 domain-containing protein [Galbibacter marinus]EKF56305.1 hypothetical protein I215_02243 [Galbibacter marinus]